MENILKLREKCRFFKGETGGNAELISKRLALCEAKQRRETRMDV